LPAWPKSPPRQEVVSPPSMSIWKMLYLLILFGTPAVVLAASKTRVLPMKGNLKLALISFLILYAYIVGSAWLTDYQIEQRLHLFDLDGDGSLNSNEMTPEAKAALDRFSQDTGRKLAPITGFIFSSLYVSVFHLVVWSATKYLQNRVK
jgi:hypothetical protein